MVQDGLVLADKVFMLSASKLDVLYFFATCFPAKTDERHFHREAQAFVAGRRQLGIAKCEGVCSASAFEIA